MPAVQPYDIVVYGVSGLTSCMGVVAVLDYAGLLPGRFKPLAAMVFGVLWGILAQYTDAGAHNPILGASLGLSLGLASAGIVTQVKLWANGGTSASPPPPPAGSTSVSPPASPAKPNGPA